MLFAIIDILKGADFLIYPLALCSVVMVFIICERAYALRRDAIMPDDLVEAIVDGRAYAGGRESVLARIIEFAERHPDDEDAVKAFARLELNRMERGLPYLDIIYAAAPLLGLTGTVWSLLRVFSSLTNDTGLPDPVAFPAGWRWRFLPRCWVWRSRFRPWSEEVGCSVGSRIMRRSWM